MQTGSWRAGDFNGDGKTDLIHLWGQEYANVWLSRGDGTFAVTPFQPWPGYGMQRGSWQAGDFNGDGKTDVIHLCCPNYANLWLSLGNGSFALTPFQPSPEYAIQIGSWLSGDFNGDGKADLIHLWGQHLANIWLSQGNGTFAVTPFQPWPGYNMQFGSWQTGDFNNDGKADLVHLCCSEYAHPWLSRGDGTFDVSAFRPWPGYGLQRGGWLSGDLDGDKKTDLFHLCCPNYANIWLWRR